MKKTETTKNVTVTYQILDKKTEQFGLAFEASLNGQELPLDLWIVVIHLLD